MTAKTSSLSKELQQNSYAGSRLTRRSLLAGGLFATALHSQSSVPLANNEGGWQFIGSADWAEDANGILSSPVWQNRSNPRADLLTREDYAFPPRPAQRNSDISVDFQTRYWSVTAVGFVLRAQDAVRMYVVEFTDIERRGPEYEVRLYLQDESGYRRELTRGYAPHPQLPDKWVFDSPSAEDWEKATPGWVNARATAEGDKIRVFSGDKLVLDFEDHTYPEGHAGIIARGPVLFRNLVVSGKAEAKATPLATARPERPAFFYPYPDAEKRFGDNQTYPSILRAPNGELLLWMSVGGDPHDWVDVLLVRSQDDGKSWDQPTRVSRRKDGAVPHYFYLHRDGRLSCQYWYTNGKDWPNDIQPPRRIFSKDGGRTWSEAELLLFDGEPLPSNPEKAWFHPYSPVLTLADGTLLQFLYECRAGSGSMKLTAQSRLDRTVVIRSTDDGQTWSKPYYLDKDNNDSNETMAAQLPDGSLVAFSRALRAKSMWMTRSSDQGKTWTPQQPGSCTGECPYLLRHSSGALVLGSRGHGIFMKTSLDNGLNWSQETRISPCSGMMGMVETKDGRILVVFHESYRRPTRIRGQFFQVKTDGSIIGA